MHVVRSKAAIVLILLISFGGAVSALESVDVYSGLLYIGNPTYEPASVDGAPTGGPSPLVNVYGVSFPFELGPYFRFAVELSLFGTQYGLIPGYPKAVPMEREFANAIWFLGSMIDLTLWIDIPLSEQFGLGFNLGPSFLARAPIIIWGSGWEELDAIAAYLYGEGRFFYPEAGFFFTWRPPEIERLELSVRGRAYFPLFHAWDGEGVPFHDQFIATATLGIRIYPAAAKTADEVSEVTDESG